MIGMLLIEVEKIFHLKRTYILFALIVVFLGLMLWGVSEARFHILEKVAARWHLEPSDYINGLSFTRIALQPTCLFLFPLFVEKTSPLYSAKPLRSPSVPGYRLAFV